MKSISPAARAYAQAEPIATIGDFPDRLFEIGCDVCDRHGYFSQENVRLPKHLTFADASLLLICSNCNARNRRPGFPVWIRPDARGPKNHDIYYEHPAKIDRPGRDWYQQEKHLRLPINAWLRDVRTE